VTGYLVYLILLLLTGVLFGIARLLRLKISFEKVFKALAITYLFLPLVLFVCFMVAMASLMAITGVLYATGLLPVVSHWSVWSWFPNWVWLAIATLGVFGAGVVNLWAKGEFKGVTGVGPHRNS